MPPRFAHPGVYVQDAPPQGARPIVAVATSVVAMVLDLQRGPVNVPIRVTRTNFGSVFGAESLDFPDTLLASQFFANGGSDLYVIRAQRVNSRASAWTSSAVDPVWTVTAGQIRPGENVGSPSPGTWGNNLRLTLTPAINAKALLRIDEVDADGVGSVKSESYDRLDLLSFSRVVNGDSQLVFVSEAEPTELPPWTGTLAANPYEVPEADEVVSGTVSVLLGASSTPGTEFQLEVNVELERGDSVAVAASKLQTAIRSAALAQAPSRPEIFKYLLGARVQAVDGRLFLTGTVFAGCNLAARMKMSQDLGFRGVAEDRPGPLRHVLGGGLDGGPAETDAPRIGRAEIIGTAVDRTGIFALEDLDLFNILCLPGLAELEPAIAGMAYDGAAEYCDGRRAFLIVDMPSGINSPEEAEVWARDASPHGNAAAYFPRLLYRTIDADRLPATQSLANSAAMAGLYARTDTARGVWKAPAGLEADIRLASDLEYRMNDGENGLLNPIGVNALRVFPVNGRVSWGARTRRGADSLADQFKYVPVRRTAYFLAESLYRGTQWAVFEPNDEPLWSQLRLSVGAFMNQQFRKGAFQGGTAREAYLVKCDAETTTQADVDRGIVNIVVGFAPLKPAEFVFIEIRQLTREGA